MTADRALFDRLPRLSDLVPFVPLADGLPTPVERVTDGLWIQRDDRTSSAYGGNKVRKFEFVLPVAQHSPCLPRVSVLNCDQIPADKKPVRVTGSDPYRLDADHNGIGCQSG